MGHGEIRSQSGFPLWHPYQETILSIQDVVDAALQRGGRLESRSNLVVIVGFDDKFRAEAFCQWCENKCIVEGVRLSSQYRDAWTVFVYL